MVKGSVLVGFRAAFQGDDGPRRRIEELRQVAISAMPPGYGYVRRLVAFPDSQRSAVGVHVVSDERVVQPVVTEQIIARKTAADSLRLGGQRPRNPMGAGPKSRG